MVEFTVHSDFASCEDQSRIVDLILRLHEMTNGHHQAPKEACVGLQCTFMTVLAKLKHDATNVDWLAQWNDEGLQMLEIVMNRYSGITSSGLCGDESMAALSIAIIIGCPVSRALVIGPETTIETAATAGFFQPQVCKLLYRCGSSWYLKEFWQASLAASEVHSEDKGAKKSSPEPSGHHPVPPAFARSLAFVVRTLHITCMPQEPGRAASHAQDSELLSFMNTTRTP